VKGESASAPNRSRTALVLHMNALGEAVFSLPLLHALKHTSPAWRVVSAVRGASGELISASGLADEVLFRIPAFGLRCHLNLISSARAARPCACLALSTSRSNSVLAWLSRAPRRIGFRDADFGFLLETRLPLEGSGVGKYLAFLKPLGIEPAVTSYCGLVRVPSPADDRAVEMLAECGVDPDAPFVALSPISTGKVGLKAYTPGQWSAVCRLLVARGVPLVVVGTSQDAPQHQFMLEGIGERAASLAGKTSALVLAAVLRRAACVVGVDTGPVHVAAALGRPCVVLFGSADPRRSAPCGDGNVILSAGLKCQPCLDLPCRLGGACMRLITPEMVIEAVTSVLSRPRGS
jgi:ADP-heptose:LPS heptosyltransferase